MIHVPEFFREGVVAAHVGTRMSDISHPMGFTFCPYPDQSVQRWNFIDGCVHAYMGEDTHIPGEQ